MTEQAFQIIARGPRVVAEAAAQAVDADIALEGATYSILEEDEDKGVWRIDAFPTSDAEAAGFEAVLGDFDGLKVTREVLADADWLAMALSGLLRTQERAVKAAYLARGFRVVFAIRRDAWVALVLRRA